MANTLNFNTIKKEYLTVTLPDEKRTVLMVGTPNKGLLTELVNIKESIEQINEDVNSESVDNLFFICAKLMNRNKGGIEIKKEFLEDIFDVEDVLIFLNAYMDFIQGISNRKN